MFQQIILTSINSEQNIQPSAFSSRHPKNKKYMFHKMIPKQQRQIFMKFKPRANKKNPQYFSQMLRQQKKKMFINTFIRKLKNSITLSKPPQQLQFSYNIGNQQQLECIQIQKNVQVILSFFLICQITILLLFNSLGIIFNQFANNSFVKWYNVFSFIVHIFQIGMKLFVKHDYEQKRKKKLKQNIKSYINSEDLIIDTVVFLGFAIIFMFQYFQKIEFDVLQTVSQLTRLLKIKTLLICLSHLELVLIQNQYREELWNLIKVFLLNFVIAHFIALMLIAMSSLNKQKNWIIQKQLRYSSWDQIYVWSYYWATTIMLTVGFGDICPTNQIEAMCMIFIETMSCIVLAYNINRVGSIISKIRSYDLQKINNLKVFNQISQKAQINTNIEDKITNYIKQSTVIKRNYNFQEQKNFISKLPISFKDQLLKQMNKRIWNGMTFFQNLSQKTLLELSKRLQKKLTHPEEIVYTRGSQIDIMIFNNGTLGLSYHNGKARSNGTIMQQIEIKQNQFKIVSLDFILSRTLNYDIKCIDYMVYYKVLLSQFIETLKSHSFDYQYYFMVKDKDKFLLNEFQIQKCKICQNQRHNIFKCPRLHYMPLRKHIIDKNKKQNKFQKIKKLDRFKRIKILSEYDALLKKQEVRQQLIKIRLQISQEQESKVKSISYQQVAAQSLNKEDSLFGSKFDYQSYYDGSGIGLNTQFFKPINYQKPLLAKVVDQLKQNIRNFKQNTYFHHGHSVWQVQCDLAHNYKFYFKQFNSQDLDIKLLKRSKFKHS